MSEFNIYKLNEDLSVDGEPVEIGLSPGEMRQALLDRADADLRRNHKKFVRSFLRAEGAVRGGFFDSREELKQKFENLIYDLDDEFFKDKEFLFYLDPVKVEEDE